MTESRRIAFQALRAHARMIEAAHMCDMFAGDPGRFARFSLAHEDMLLDYSKNRIGDEGVGLLLDLAHASKVAEWRDRMFAGERINATEGRAVWHVALRNPGRKRPFVLDGRDVTGDVEDVLLAMSAFCDGVRHGKILGTKGDRFTDVVNIGIGGSDLGPAMVTQALAPWHDGPAVHFVSNVDGAHLHDTLRGLNPATTLFLVASKTFTTLETMTNAASARAWIAGHLGEGAVGAHFAAISTAIPKVKAFGISEDRTFGFWDWVGGRYSVWSAIGLPVMMAIGPQNFRDFLAGGAAMDDHFREAPLDRNMPVILAMLGVWYRCLLGFPSHAVIAYDQRLSRFAAHLQQLDMESNGKRTRKDGRLVEGPTGPIVWGEPGTNGQHAFFQLLHQGTDVVPVDFLLAVKPNESMGDHHAKLVANCLAQAEALMNGKGERAVRKELVASGMDKAAMDRLTPHKIFPGNRPSNMLLYRRLDPYTLGRLLALYEHKVFVQGLIFDVNSFDQWGVELGKQLATELLPMVKGEAPVAGKDASTTGLLAHFHTLARES